MHREPDLHAEPEQRDQRAAHELHALRTDAPQTATPMPSTMHAERAELSEIQRARRRATVIDASTMPQAAQRFAAIGAARNATNSSEAAAGKPSSRTHARRAREPEP